MTLAVQKVVGDLERKTSHHLADGPLGGRRVHFPQEGKRHRLDRFHLAAPVTVRTLKGARLVQGLADTLPGHLQKAELRDAGDVHARLVRLERVLQGLLHLGVVLSVTHVDEVDDDQPAQVAQPQLARRLLGGLQVGLERGVLDTLLAGGLAGVDVDGYERLGRLDEDGAPRLERHLLLVDEVDLLLELVARKEGTLLLVHLDELFEGRIDFLERLAHVLINILAVDEHLVYVGGEVIPDGPNDQGGLLVDHPRPFHGHPFFADPLVQRHQAVKVLLQLFTGAPHRLGADDVAVPLGDGHLGDHLLELLALTLALNLARDPGGIASRHHHHVAARQRDVRGEGGSLVVALPLLHLDDQLLPPSQHLLDAGTTVALVLGNIVTPLPVLGVQLPHLQKAELLEPDVDEGCLQPLLDANHDPLVDVAARLLVAGDLDIEIHQASILHDCHARLFRVQRIDQHFSCHKLVVPFPFGAAGSRWRCRPVPLAPWFVVSPAVPADFYSYMQPR